MHLVLEIAVELQQTWCRIVKAPSEIKSYLIYHSVRIIRVWGRTDPIIHPSSAGGIYAFMKQKQKKQAEKEALDPDADYTEDKGDFEIPTDVPDEDEAPDEQDTEPIWF